MTTLESLLSLEPPSLHVTQMSDSPRYSLSLALSKHPGVVAREIRGKKCSTVPRLFDEVGAALQFPWYFGENWDAFDECVCDLEWLPGIAVVVIVTDAELLLAQEPRGLPTLFELLHDAGHEWSVDLTPPRLARPARPFHVVLESALAAGDLRAKLGLGADTGVLADWW